MADAVAALERGFGSFKERSRSPKRKAVWPAPVPDFYKDVVGVLGVKDGHGLLLEEAFPVDPVPLSRQVLGARRKKARRLRPPSPPGRRYFRKSAQVAKSEQETSWQVAVAAAAAEVGKSQELPGEGAPDFLPLLTASAQLGAPSWAAACRGARLAALRARCQHAPGDVSNWLDFAEFQWSQRLGRASAYDPLI
ncbi:unnamed protein product [Effrenium voratum]|nr:unnamed protein product [Effrenium voratum]